MYTVNILTGDDLVGVLNIRPLQADDSSENLTLAPVGTALFHYEFHNDQTGMIHEGTVAHDPSLGLLPLVSGLLQEIANDSREPEQPDDGTILLSEHDG